MDACAYPGCETRPVALGLCRPHYMRRRALSAPPCEVEGCERPSARGGLCSHHRYEQEKASRPPDVEPLSPAARRREALLPRARRLRKAGWSYAAIGRELGVSGDTISGWLRRAR